MGDRFIQPLRDLWNRIQNVYYTNCRADPMTHTVQYYIIHIEILLLPILQHYGCYEVAVVGCVKLQRRIVTNYDFDRWVQQKWEQFCWTDKRENYNKFECKREQ